MGKAWINGYDLFRQAADIHRVIGLDLVVLLLATTLLVVIGALLYPRVAT